VHGGRLLSADKCCVESEEKLSRYIICWKGKPQWINWSIDGLNKWTAAQVHVLGLNLENVLGNVHPPRPTLYVQLTLWGPVGCLSWGSSWWRLPVPICQRLAVTDRLRRRSNWALPFCSSGRRLSLSEQQGIDCAWGGKWISRWPPTTESVSRRRASSRQIEWNTSHVLQNRTHSRKPAKERDCNGTEAFLKKL